MLFRRRLDGGLRFNFSKDRCGNFFASSFFLMESRKMRVRAEAAWQTDTSITCNVVTAGSPMQACVKVDHVVVCFLYNLD